MTRSVKLRIFAKIYPLSDKLWKVATCFWMLTRYLFAKVPELITVRLTFKRNKAFLCNARVTAESNVSFGCFCLIILFGGAVFTVTID